MKTTNNSNEMPKAVSYTKHLGMRVLTINYGVEKVDEPDEMNGKYRYASVTLPAGVMDYRTIVSAIVNNEYSNDEMQAVINNYMLDPDDEEVRNEWDMMQAVRAYAKQLAHRYIDGLLTENSPAPSCIQVAD